MRMRRRTGSTAVRLVVTRPRTAARCSSSAALDTEPVKVDEPRKAALRTAALAARRQLRTGERAAASVTVVERLAALPELEQAEVVLLHAALAEEVDIGGLVGLLRERGARTLFPRVHGDALELVSTADLRTLELGYRGILEPVGPAVPADDVEVVILPGVAFDPHGGRLGQGGGHYDRLLPTLRPEVVRIGVCFACQVVPSVPREAHDEAVDLVVTERATYRPTRPRHPQPEH